MTHRLTNLEGLLAHYLDVSPRRRKSKIELKLEGHTDAYVYLILAWAFARAGDEHRAGQLVEQARELLTPHLDDPIHATAMSKYLAKIGRILQELERNHDEHATTGRKSAAGIELAAGYRVLSHQRIAGADVDAFYRAIIRNLAWSDWSAVEHSCATIMDELRQSLVDATDKMSTNAHFCLAVIFRMEVWVRLLLLPDVVQP